jgi:O-antigen/teichoic acid export membrane protein
VQSRSIRMVGQTVLPHVLILAVRTFGLIGGIGAQLFMARLITDAYGIEQYGYVMLAAGIPALLPFASIGVTAPVINRFALYEPSHHDHSAAETLRAAFRMLTKISVLLVSVSVVLSATSSWGSLLGVPAVHQKGLSGVMVAVIGGVAVSLFGGVGMAVLVGLGNVLETLTYQMLQPVAIIGGVLLLHSLDAPALYFATTVPASQIIIAIVSVWGANRRCKGLIRSALIDGLLHRNRHTKILSQAAPMAVIQTARALGLQSDRLILSHASTATQLGQYSVVAPMYQAGVSVASSLALSLWPVFTRRRGSAEARTFLTATTIIFAVLGVLMALGIVTVGPIVYHTVVGTDPPETAIFAFFGLLLLITSALQPISMFLTDGRGLAFQAGATVISQGANFLVSWILAGTMGASGVVLASVLCMSVLLALPLLGMIFIINNEENLLEDKNIV